MIHLRVLGSLDIRDAAGRDLRDDLSQPKRLALLAYLAVAPPSGFHRRDRLVGMFWPELNQARARAALRKGVHALRGLLGQDAIVGRGTEELALNRERVQVDAVLFERALDQGRLPEALQLYRGDLMDGLFLSAAPEFERWLDQERTRLRGRAAAAAWALVDIREAAGGSLEALQLGRRALSLSPDDESAVRRMIALLDRRDDRAGALHAYESFARQLADEYAAQPTDETQRLIEAVRARAGRQRGEVPPAPAPPVAVARRRGRVATALVTVALLVVGSWAARSLEAGRELPVTTSSRAAYRAYVQGLAGYRRGEYQEALAAFQSALAADSAFAMAAYYAAGAADERFEGQLSRQYWDVALRHAPGVSERERLLIQATSAARLGQPNALALADSLVTRHPEEQTGHDLLGQALVAQGDFLGAIQQLRQVTGRSPDGSGPCPACEAQRRIAYAYQMADSMEAAVRVAREMVASEPASAGAWHQLATALELTFRLDEALAANRNAANLRIGDQEDVTFPGAVAMRQGRFAEADSLFRREAADSSRAVRERATWDLIISLRAQGRLVEALDQARRFRVVTAEAGSLQSAISEAQVLCESGRHRQAAALFDSIAHQPPAPVSPAQTARNLTWHLTHEASALAAAGDTARLPALERAVEEAGRGSAYGRDPLLHHYVRGLLAAARGRFQAAAAEFEAANFSLTGGFSRNNLEWGRALLALDRPDQAIAILQGALHGPPDASGFYTTTTELHEMLARAFLLAGRRDSAEAHYHWVLEAWRNADPALRARREQVQIRLSLLHLPRGSR